MKNKERLFIILGAIVLGIILGFLSYYVKNKFVRLKSPQEEPDKVDIYMNSVNRFNEIFSNFEFNDIASSYEDPAEDWRCVSLNQEQSNEYVKLYEDLYGNDNSSFINLIIRVHRDGTESKSLTLCKPLNCDITPISNDLYQYKEENDKKYLEIGEKGNKSTYELEEQDGKIKSKMPIVYCPYY